MERCTRKSIGEKKEANSKALKGAPQRAHHNRSYGSEKSYMKFALLDIQK